MVFIDEYTGDYINNLSDLNRTKESLESYQNELKAKIVSYEQIKLNARNLGRDEAVDFLDSKLKTISVTKIS